MNVFAELYEAEINNLKTLIERELNFTPKSDLPEDIQAEVYDHGWGRPDLIQGWKKELENPKVTYINCFDGKEYPIKAKRVEARKNELLHLIERHTGRKQIPLNLDQKLDELIQSQLDFEEEGHWYYDEEDVISMRIGLPDSPNDVPDEWYERG